MFCFYCLAIRHILSCIDVREEIRLYNKEYQNIIIKDRKRLTFRCLFQLFLISLISNATSLNFFSKWFIASLSNNINGLVGRQSTFNHCHLVWFYIAIIRVEVLVLWSLWLEIEHKRSITNRRWFCRTWSRSSKNISLLIFMYECCSILI